MQRLELLSPNETGGSFLLHILYKPRSFLIAMSTNLVVSNLFPQLELLTHPGMTRAEETLRDCRRHFPTNRHRMPAMLTQR